MTAPFFHAMLVVQGRKCRIIPGETMALPIRQQLTYWGIASIVLTVVLWALGNVIMPFLVGAAIAYFLDPVADRLQRLGLGRVGATLVITSVGLLFLIALMLAVVPTLSNQAHQLVQSAPDMIEKLQGYLYAQFPQLADNTSVMRQELQQLGDTLKSRGMELLDTVIGSARGVLEIVLFIVIVPVVSFYMLIDWDRMVSRIDQLLPRDHAPLIRRLAREIDRTLAGFLRGQMLVCLIVGLFYASTLALAGLQFGLVVGAIAGAITFIPYFGSIVGGALAIGLALVQFWGDWVHVGVIIGIFAVGQFLEGNIITPRLVGNSVGLHPLWLIFALSAFGSLFGFVGMLVAVPLAAAIGVLVRHATRSYVHSQLYRGTCSRKPPPADD